MPDGEGVPVAIGAHDVEGGVANVELLDDGGWSIEVRAAAGWEVFLIGAAAYWRYDDVEALDAHQAHTVTKKEKIEPAALNDEAACGADGGKL